MRRNKSLIEKCKALKDLEKGMSNKDVAEKYGVRLGLKNKKRLLPLLEKKEWTLNEKIYGVDLSKT